MTKYILKNNNLIKQQEYFPYSKDAESLENDLSRFSYFLDSYKYKRLIVTVERDPFVDNDPYKDLSKTINSIKNCCKKGDKIEDLLICICINGRKELCENVNEIKDEEENKFPGLELKRLSKIMNNQCKMFNKIEEETKCYKHRIPNDKCYKCQTKYSVKMHFIKTIWDGYDILYLIQEEPLGELYMRKWLIKNVCAVVNPSYLMV